MLVGPDSVGAFVITRGERIVVVGRADILARVPRLDHYSPAPTTSSAAACPEDPTLADVIALDRDGGPMTAAFRPLYGTYAEAALACFGNKELQFVAFVAAPEGLGGVETYRIEPLWLVGRDHWLAVDDSMEPEGFASGPFMSVAVSPAGEALFADLDRRWVEVRGHFADPAAELCRVTDGAPPTAPTGPQAIEICRTSFVLTAIQPVPAPSPAA